MASDDDFTLDALETLVVEKEKKFRFAGLRVHLTFKGYFDILNYIKLLEMKSTRLHVAYFSGVQEKGNTGYEHTHMALEFSCVFATENVKFFDIDDIHPNIKKIGTIKHWENVMKYHKKQGIPMTNEYERTEGKLSLKKTKKESKIKGKEEEKKKEFTVEDALSYATAKEAMLACNDVRRVGGINAAFQYKTREYGEEPDVRWRTFQQKLFDIMEEPPHDRRVYWIYDKDGKSGKTTWAKHAFAFRDAYYLTHCDMRDISTTLIREVDAGNRYNSIIIDIARSGNEAVMSWDLYNTIETIKNAIITSQKYVGRTVILPTMHLFVLSNDMPSNALPVPNYEKLPDGTVITRGKIMKETLTNDRLDVRVIGKIENPERKRDYDFVNRICEAEEDEELPDGYVKPGQFDF